MESFNVEHVSITVASVGLGGFKDTEVVPHAVTNADKPSATTTRAQRRKLVGRRRWRDSVAT